MSHKSRDERIQRLNLLIEYYSGLLLSRIEAQQQVQTKLRLWQKELSQL